MFYCGFDLRHAQEGVAISDDLLHWEKCPEPIIRHGEPGSLDATHAHKPCIIFHDGMLWHFYCAVRPTETPEERAKFGHEYRCILLLSSLILASCGSESTPTETSSRSTSSPTRPRSMSVSRSWRAT